MSRSKYCQTLSALGDRHFTSGLEVGCSIGVLTHMLAERCDSLLGVDIVEDPLDAARSRCADQPHVRFRRMQVPAEWPEGCFDLMVFSEVLYSSVGGRYRAVRESRAGRPVACRHGRSGQLARADGRSDARE